jgi:hypothetical protein
MAPAPMPAAPGPTRSDLRVRPSQVSQKNRLHSLGLCRRFHRRPTITSGDHDQNAPRRALSQRHADRVTRDGQHHINPRAVTRAIHKLAVDRDELDVEFSHHRTNRSQKETEIDTPDECLAAIEKMCNALRDDFMSRCEQMEARYEDLAGSVAKMKSDAVVSTRGTQKSGMTGPRLDNEDIDPRDTMAEQVAADSAAGRAALAALSSRVDDLKRQVARPMADLNAFADAQEKADKVMRVHGTRAEPHMAGEDIIAYNIRLAKKMQPYSKTWKGVELSLIAPDRQAFNIALDGIRADALQAGLNPTHLPPFQHQEIVEQGKGGHTITKFVGKGTIFAQLSSPYRNVKRFGTRSVSPAQ